MLNTLSFLAIATLTLPMPQPQALFTAQPESPRQGSITVVLFVAPDRSVQDCAVRHSDLDEKRSRKVCEQMSKPRFRSAAVGPDGKPAYSEARVTFLLGDTVESSDADRSADIEVPVKARADGNTDKIRTALVVLIDGNGTMSQCEAGQGQNEALAQIACQQFGSFQWQVRQDASGQPVEYVTTAVVDFVPQPA